MKKHTSIIFDWNVNKLWFISGLEFESKLSRRCWKAHAAHWKCVHDTFMPWTQYPQNNVVMIQLKLHWQLIHLGTEKLDIMH